MPLTLMGEDAKCKDTVHFTVNELWAQRHESNKHLLDTLKPDRMAGEIMRKSSKDAMMGVNSMPERLTTEVVQNTLLCRRFTVPQLKSNADGDWLDHRLIDHFTENAVNLSTIMVEKYGHESLDIMMWMIEQMMQSQYGGNFSMYKADVKSAFKKLPLYHGHHDLAVSVWRDEAGAYFIRHHALPFGATGSVAGWWRMGEFLTHTLRCALKVPVGRFVDDMFGTARMIATVVNGKTIPLHAHAMVDVLCELIGTAVDPGKSIYNVTKMTLLGAQVMLDLGRRTWQHQVCQLKGKKWATDIELMLQHGCCTGGQASKMAGRLSYTAQLCCDKAARAYMRPLHRQAHAPLAAGHISKWL